MTPDGLRRIAFVLAFFVFVCALSGACRARETGRAAQRGSRPPNVLLITVDTLRPDALGWVSARNPTPEIDRLAREGFAFSAAVASVPFRDNGQLFT